MRIDPAWTVAAVLAGLVVASIWAFGFFPMHDGVQHVVGGFLGGHVDDPSRDHAVFFRASFPVAAAGYVILGRPLVTLLGWEAGVRAFATLVTLGFGAGVLRLATALHPERRFIAAAFFGATLSWPLYMGLYPFCAALAVLPWALACVVGQDELRWRGAAVAAVLLVVTALFHAFVGAAALGMVALVLLLRAPRRLLVLLLPLAWLALSAYLGARQDSAIDAPEKRLPLVEAARLWAVTSVGGPWYRAWPLPLAALVGLGWGAVRAARGRASRAEIALTLVGVGCAIALFVIPFHVARWQFFSPRFAVLGVPLGLVLLPAERWSSLVRRLALGVGAVAAVVAIGWSCNFHLTVDVQTDDLRAVMKASPPVKGTLVVLNWNPGVGAIGPIEHQYPLVFAPELFVVEKGGNSPHVNATNPALHAVVARDFHEHFPAFPPRFLSVSVPSLPSRVPRALEQGAIASQYDTLVFVGLEPEDAEPLIERGYRPLARVGSAMVAKFEPCPRVVRIDPPFDPKALKAQLSWYPLLEPGPIEVRVDERPGVLELHLLNAPCGTAAVRVLRDDRPACENANRDGWLVVREPTAVCATPTPTP